MRRTLYLITALGLGAGPLRAQASPEPRVMIPMRDGTKLAADVWLPSESGRHPVVLARTPYLRTGLGLPAWGKFFASHGYAFVAQDTRGRGDSEGEFSFLFGDGKDGFDTIEWLAAQPWSTGRVGTLGLSYLGTVQWLAARERPPHLTCMVPTASAGRWFEEAPYLGGAFLHAWALDFANLVSGRIPETPSQPIDWPKVLSHRPLRSADSVLGRPLPLYQAFLANSTWGAFWNRLRFTRKDFAAIAIPTLTVTGWYDGDQAGSLFYWRGLMANAANPDRHFLTIGPWRHPETFRGGSAKVGDTELSPESIVDIKAVHLAFFDWCLKGTSREFAAPRARVYLTGAHAWRDLDRYPPREAAATRLYLASSGHANSSRGDGRLSWRPVSTSSPDRFRFDPRDPVPDEFENWGADRGGTQGREDVLVYTSDPLAEPLEVIGSVSLDLWASSDARDTDFTAVLSDVGPDGVARKLGPAVGIRRARYRNGYDREELLTPGKSARFEIELFDIGHRFAAGHRLRLEISSSAVPYFTPNQNTGNPIATDTEWKVAQQTVYHDRLRPSAIRLPVVSGRPAQSGRSTSMGSTRNARRAGNQLAATNASTRTPAAPR